MASPVWGRMRRGRVWHVCAPGDPFLMAVWCGETEPVQERVPATPPRRREAVPRLPDCGRPVLRRCRDLAAGAARRAGQQPAPGRNGRRGMSQCRFCFATIKFVRLDTGKPIPVDPIPFPDKGNVAARLVGHTLEGYVLSQAKPLRPGYDRYVPHRAACKPDKPRHTAAERTPTLLDA